MSLRHIAAAVLGLGPSLLVLSAAGGRSSEPEVPIDLNDGTIQVSASVGGLGTWVPYTITVRNLGDHRFEGVMLLVNPPQPGAALITHLPPIAGSARANPPITSAAQPVAPPAAAYQVHLVLDSRHKKAVARGLERLPGSVPVGGVLLEPDSIHRRSFQDPALHPCPACRWSSGSPRSMSCSSVP